MENVYQFDFDENNQPRLTKKNVDLIKFVLSNDSNYLYSADENYNKSSKFFAYKIKEKFNANQPILREDIFLFAQAVDKENSTHAKVSGHIPGEKNNQGLEILVDKILSIENVFEKIKNGNKEIVNEIASCVDGYSKLSFATKFCTYASIHIFEKDNYSIYDKIVKDVLPYFAWKYLDNKNYVKKNRTSDIDSIIIISKKPTQVYDYVTYCKLIDDIIDKAAEKENYRISRRSFDHLLWYYYKGLSVRVQKALDTIPLD